MKRPSWRLVTLSLVIVAILLIGAGALVYYDHQGSTSISQDCPILASTQLTIQRAKPANPERFVLPARFVVRNHHSVQAIANALCQLPAMPTGTISCPADLGPEYTFHFATNRTRFRIISLDATGCEAVSGLGNIRWVERSPGFWHQLGTALGYPRASYDSFRGRLLTDSTPG
jgi:hypothetical protein